MDQDYETNAPKTAKGKAKEVFVVSPSDLSCLNQFFFDNLVLFIEIQIISIFVFLFFLFLLVIIFLRLIFFRHLRLSLKLTTKFI